MSTHKQYETIILPSRGKTRALSVSGTQADYAMSDLFGSDWRDGNYFTMTCTQPFYLQSSSALSGTITPALVIGDDSDVGEDPDEHPGRFAANTEYRFLLEKDDTHLHVIADAGGTLRIWRSSSVKI